MQFLGLILRITLIRSVAFRQGKEYNFCEFGHLFWRPLGWLARSQFFPWLRTVTGGGNKFTFQWFNYIARFRTYVAFVLYLHKEINESHKNLFRNFFIDAVCSDA